MNVFVLLNRLSEPVGVFSTLDGAIDSFRHAVFATLTGREPSTDNDHEDIESMIVRYVEENSTTYRLEYTRPQTSYPVETLRVKVFTVDTAW